MVYYGASASLDRAVRDFFSKKGTLSAESGGAQPLLCRFLEESDGKAPSGVVKSLLDSFQRRFGAAPRDQNEIR